MAVRFAVQRAIQVKQKLYNSKASKRAFELLCLFYSIAFDKLFEYFYVFFWQ